MIVSRENSNFGFNQQAIIFKIRGQGGDDDDDGDDDHGEHEHGRVSAVSSRRVEPR